MPFHRRLDSQVSQRKGFFRKDKGAVALMWGLALIPLLGMLGVTIDIGRDYYVHSVIAGATDAAAVAGAKAAGNGGDVTAQATAIFYANIPANFTIAFGATISGPNITISGNNQTVSVSAKGTIPTTFMMVLGKTNIAAAATSQAQVALQGAEVVLALDNTGSMAGAPIQGVIDASTELVKVLYGGPAIDKVNGLYVAVVPFSTTVNIGMTGFNPNNWLTAAGNVQVANTNLYPNIAASGQNVGGKWMGCIEARTPPLYALGMDSLDTPPTSNATKFTPYLYPSTMAHQYVVGAPLNRGLVSTSTTALATPAALPLVPSNPPWGLTGATRGDNDWKLDGTVPAGSGLRFGDNYNLLGGNKDGNYGVGPNLGCPIPMLPLTASQKTVQATITNMKATSRGGTMINLGLDAAWWMISPQWTGLWPTVPANMPQAYGKTQKFVILMTDGQNQWYDWPTGVPGAPAPGGNAAWGPKDADYTGYGRLAEGRTGTTNFAATTGILNNSMANMCAALKANPNVVVYTILFNHNGSATGSEALFQACATQPTAANPGPFYYTAITNAQLKAVFSSIGSSITNLRLSWPGVP